MLGVLDPAIMPAQGNRADLAISQAVDLLQQGAPGRGRILLISDDVPRSYHSAISNHLAGTGYALSTLVVGTPEGGPIPLAKRGFLRSNGEIVVARADPDAMERLARDNGGDSHELTLGDADIRALALEPGAEEDWSETDDGLTINRWKDDGYWLLWLALPLLLLGWRRGSFAAMALTLLPVIPQPASALDWGGLWQREDQRAAELIREDPNTASDILDSPEWRGSALYRAERYAEAAEAFARAESPLADYNRGNALARAGKVEEALEAYDIALARNPDMEDARVNRQLVQDLLNQQEESSSQDQGQGDQGDNDQSNSDQNNRDQNSSDSSGEDSDQQSEGSESSDQNEEGSQNPQDSGGESEQSQGENGEQEESDQEQSVQGQQGNDSDSSGAESGGAEAQPPAPISETPLIQSQEQSLRRIPDNPGGLLQRKFLQQYQERQTPSDEGDTPW